MLRWATVLVLLLGWVSPARATTVAGVTLPTRRLATPLVAARLERVTALVSRELGAGDPVPAPGAPLDLSPRLDHAYALFGAGQLDDAAAEIDRALTEGARVVGELRDPSRFLQAHLTRAAIALARGEADRAGALLDRALRYDPSLELSVTERSPAMRAALENARRRMGPHPALVASDLGGACDAAQVLIVARVLDEHTVELSRLDRCRFTAAVLLGGAIDEAMAASTLARAAPGADVAAAPPRSPAKLRRPGWPFAVGGGLAVGVAAVGAGLVGSVAGDYDRLRVTCADGTCAPSLYEAFQRRATAGWVLIGIGAAGASAALISWLVVRRPGAAATAVVAGSP